MTDQRADQPSDPVEVTVTCADEGEARAIARALVEARLVACAQWWPITSCYRWEEAVVEDAEHLVLCKATADRFDEVVELVRSLHSYDLPAIAMWRLDGVGPGYRQWLRGATDS